MVLIINWFEYSEVLPGVFESGKKFTVISSVIALAWSVAAMKPIERYIEDFRAGEVVTDDASGETTTDTYYSSGL